MEQRCRWGIAGTGKIAAIMAHALRNSATGQLVAVASQNDDRARRFASDTGIDRHHDSYAALAADPEIEIVYVATHHTEHHATAMAAAGAGKHVLCEKPLAMNAALAADIVQSARRNGVFLMEAFAYRCHPQTARLVEILRNGDIGEVRMVDAAFGYDAGGAADNYLLVRELGGGSILDVGCYPTSMAHLIAAADSTLSIYGTEGTVTVRSPWLPGRFGPEPVIVLRRYGSDPQEIPVAADADLYALEADAVGRLVRDGRASHPLMSWDESLANMATLDRWRAAIGLSYPDDEDEPNAPGAAARNRVVPAGSS